MPETFPRSSEYQRKRDDLAREIKDLRKQRDAIREDAKRPIARAQRFLGIKDVGAAADELQEKIKTSLEEGKKELSDEEVRYRWEAFDSYLTERERMFTEFPGMAASVTEEMWSAVEKRSSLVQDGLQDRNHLVKILPHLSFLYRNGVGDSREKAKDFYFSWLEQNFENLGALAEESPTEMVNIFLRALVDRKGWGEGATEQKILDLASRYYRAIHEAVISEKSSPVDARRILSMLLREGNTSARDSVFKTMKEVFAKHGAQEEELARLFLDCKGDSADETEMIQRRMISLVAESYALDPEKIVESWRLSGKTHHTVDHIKRLSELERERPGNCCAARTRVWDPRIWTVPERGARASN